MGLRAGLRAGPPEGLRERKKQLTREALVRASLELFIAQGYERTTVDEIAEAVEVSQRTFFRYFAGKEEVALASQSRIEAHVKTLMRARPPEERPFEAMRNAVLAGWDSLGEAIGESVPVSLHMRSYLLIESTPALIAAHLRRSMELEEEMAALIAEREGLDASDPRPRLAVAAFSGVMKVAGRLWSQGDDLSVRALRDLMVASLDSFGPAMAADWRSPAP
ncbi:TetR family transcriptional regulator [Streptomyces inusitatus]|uniref:TetR family transcriptional regulator n=1 Tax=Streptomyces inusitatus TaxID=68221 RepID=A0A918UMI7_9ACTN|nr:TetR family transcriptional regulator [Streptomyces inusitatus]